MAAEFTRFSETILTKQAQRVVSITVKPMISDCTGRIYFTDLMVQEGDRLTGYVINTETILQKYREEGSVVPPRFYNGVVRSAETVVLFNLGSDTTGWTVTFTRCRTWRLAAYRSRWGQAHIRRPFRQR